jgi:cyclomaltodextrinase / maltogenic alpha-amylase / neopullulanase
MPGASLDRERRRIMRPVTRIALFGLLLPLLAAGQDRDFSQLAARPSPEWAHSAVVYEVNVRTFSPTGNFQGVTARLGDLKKLGVNLLWLMPIHPNGLSNKKGTLGSPYAVRDYYAIEPAFGSAADLRALVDGAHQLGMKVVIDIVANHTAWDSVMMAHPEFYKKDSSGHIISPIPDWSDVAGLDYRNADLREYMTKMLEYWLREFHLDGFRCDAAAMVPTSFWEQARARLDKIQPSLFLLAEASAPDLMVTAFDADYEWPVHSALTDVVENGKPANLLRDVWNAERKKFPRGTVHMYFSDNHDEKRAIARFGEKGALAASALVFALDGVPMLYNGMEVGDTTESGGPALFEPLKVFWPIAERRPEFREFYEQIIALRTQHPALRTGQLEWLDNSGPASVLTFLRRGEGEDLLIAVNLTNRPFAGTVTGAGAGFIPLGPTTAPLPTLQLDAWAWRLYRAAR